MEDALWEVWRSGMRVPHTYALAVRIQSQTACGKACACDYYSTVTDLARFPGWSTSVPIATAVK